MNSIKIMLFLWQLGIVDSLTFLQFCINCGAQYTGLTLVEAAGYMGLHKRPQNDKAEQPHWPLCSQLLQH